MKQSPEVFYEKHFCRSLSSNKVKASGLLKKRLRHWRFPVNFSKLLKNSIHLANNNEEK